MKKYYWLLAAVFSGVLLAPSALATCPTPESGPYFLGGGPVWYDYSADPSCVAINAGSPSPVTMWCYSTPAWSVGSTLTEFSYTLSANRAYSQYWDADIFVEFNDPNNSAGNWIEMWVRVTHNGVTSSTLLWSHDGTVGDISCQRHGGAFTAVTGDTIEIVVYARKASSNATLQVSAPNIFAYF